MIQNKNLSCPKLKGAQQVRDFARAKDIIEQFEGMSETMKGLDNKDGVDFVECERAVAVKTKLPNRYKGKDSYVGTARYYKRSVPGSFCGKLKQMDLEFNRDRFEFKRDGDLEIYTVTDYEHVDQVIFDREQELLSYEKKRRVR